MDLMAPALSADKVTMTDLLFATPSFAAGVGRALDIGGQFDAYNISRTPQEADAKAILADFMAIGRDLARAMCQVREDSGAQE
jgi:hypothetical protein